MKGILIPIEGGEGAGKTTQIRLLEEVLPKLYPDRTFVITREPGGTKFAEKVYELFKQNMMSTDARTQIGLIFASRFDHVANLIRPRLEAGEVVITDRYVATTFAYQVMMDRTLIDLYRAHLPLVPKPDCSFVIKTSVDVALERIHARKGEATDFDLAAREFHEQLARGFQHFADQSFSPVTFINGDRTPEEIHADLLRGIKKLLG
jgi:dTMP kinase